MSDESPFFDPHAEIETHRHRLPHWQQGGKFYFVTWRLADALPREKIDEWRDAKDAWMHWHPDPWDTTAEQEYHELFSDRIDLWLDAGTGSCLLQRRDLAEIVANALRHFDGTRYSVATFVVMPNHVHVLFQLLSPHRLEEVVKSWKGFTARAINRLTKCTGSLWQADYWDRMIRSEIHFAKCREYILANPAKAKLREGDFVLYDAPKESGFSNPL